MGNTINTRIASIIEAKGMTVNSFSKLIGIAQTSLRDVVNGGSEPKFSTLEKIIIAEPSIDANWLITGSGDMLKTNITTSEIFPTNSIEEGIPLIPISAMAGAFGGQMQVLEAECDRYVVPSFKGADFLIPVKGNSMSPTYDSGDLVACKKLILTDLFFQWNKVYVIDTDQRRRRLKWNYSWYLS